MKSIRILAAAGLFAAVAAPQAFAWSGDMVKCTASPGIAYDVVFKKGLSCKDTKNKISIKSKVKNGQGFDGCVANPAAPWAEWLAGKFEKLDPASLPDFHQAEINLKGLTFGSCNFSGSDTSAGASASGSVTFFDNGTIKPGKISKIKGAKLKFFGTVAGDLATYSADASGLITKGLGVGGDISILIGLDLAAPENGLIVACNTGGACTDPNDPNDPANQNPVEVLKVVTAGPPFPASTLTISRGEDDPNDPNDYDALP